MSLSRFVFSPILLMRIFPLQLAKLKAAHRTEVTRDLIESTLFPGMPKDSELSQGLIIGKSELTDLKDGLGAPATEMVPVILGAVEYYFSFGEPTPHYTPFVYHLWGSGCQQMIASG